MHIFNECRELNQPLGNSIETFTTCPRFASATPRLWTSKHPFGNTSSIMEERIWVFNMCLKARQGAWLQMEGLDVLHREIREITTCVLVMINLV